jgi:capsular polysaccharide export protein
MAAERHRILLLQGPMGPFFARLAKELSSLGHEVTRVAFNAGDRLFHRGPNVLSYRGSLDALPEYLGALIEARSIDTVILFGDGRPIHRAAIEEARRRGVEVLVFEEGYLRPDWITLEREGVNGHSRMPREPEAYRGQPAVSTAPAPVGATFGRNGVFATLYVVAMWLGRPFFRQYVHHRPLTPLGETYYWLLGGFRKYLYRLLEQSAQPRLTAELRERFFLVPLQVHCDYQLAHADYASIEEFALEVIASFAAHAPTDTHLVLKHHPMDRPYRDYTRLFARAARKHGIEGRLHYIHDQHLPSLLDAARGVIVMNSTVGLQALHHGTPVVALGRAIFAMPGLTHEAGLEAFFSAQEKPDPDVYSGFRHALLRDSQANGSFAKRLPGVPSPTGIRWHPSAPLGLGSSFVDR